MIADTAVFPSSLWSDPQPRLYGDNECLLADIDVERLEAEISRAKQERDEASMLRHMSLDFGSGSCDTSAASSEISDDPYVDIETDLDSTLFGLHDDQDYLSTSLLSSLGETSNFSDHVSFTGFSWTDSDFELPVDSCIDLESNSSNNDTSSEKVPSPCASPVAKRRRTISEDFVEDDTPWSGLSYSEQLTTVEKLTTIVSTEMDLRDQLEVIKIINKDAALSPTDTEFVIDLAYLNDRNVEEVREYIKKHKSTSTTTPPTTNGNGQKKMCKKQERKNYQKALKQRQRKEYKQMLKEKRSGLFKKEEVLALSSSAAEPDENYDDVDILA